MRPFKFRFWNVREGKWEKNLGLYEDGCIADLEQCFHNQLESSDFVIQQFTGLFDKNQKEIYEGDIVEVSYQMDEHGNSDIYKSEVVFERGSFGDKYDDFSNYLMLPNSSVRVVGNIFENADLLK